jgi:type II secretory ATPase GspE/PulE/Tfp pilus assembly ATPase PilB-like protein
MKLTTVEFVETVITKAASIGASDIHIDPYPAASSVRFRIDGLLKHICTIPGAAHPEIIARIKILAHLRTDVHHTPQDGRFRHEKEVGKKTAKIDYDIRVAILPTQHGENVVLRILNNKQGKLSLAELGFLTVDIERIEKSLARHQGLILVTGPTGSGKTTTLYSLIEKLNRPELSIVSLEDPIEYAIPGIRQVQVNARQGITFATGSEHHRGWRDSRCRDGGNRNPQRFDRAPCSFDAPYEFCLCRDPASHRYGYSTVFNIRNAFARHCPASGTEVR